MVKGEHHGNDGADGDQRQRDRRAQRQAQQQTPPFARLAIVGFVSGPADFVENCDVTQRIRGVAQAFIEKRVELPTGRPSAALADGAQLGRHAS